MARLYVARHGETEWNFEGRYQGRRESRLTALGERQAAALAGALAGTGARRVVSSPLRRCLQTAGEVARRLELPVEADADLLEIAHGSWEGRLRQDVARDDAVRMQAWQTSPQSVTFEGGESLAGVAARWERFVRTLTGEQDVVAVTHDVVVRVAILTAIGRSLADLWQPRVCNGGYAVFEAEPGRLRLVEESHEAHLAGLLADSGRQAL
jgi:broad specificity phosphatase PhoE